MLLILLSLSCVTTVTTDDVTCDVSLDRAEPALGAPGETVVLYGDPITELWDTALTFGSARASVVSVDRSGCDECDSCRETAGCDGCGDCDDCDLSCAASCAPTITALVPALAPGEVAVVLRNSRGTSPPLSFRILAEDTGALDSAP